MSDEDASSPSPSPSSLEEGQRDLASTCELSRSGVVESAHCAGREAPPPTPSSQEEDVFLPSPSPPKPTRAIARQATSAVAYEDLGLDPDDPLLDFAPYLHKQPRANSITPDVQRRFVAELRACGVVSHAARKVGKSLEALYKLRERPGAEGFAAAWDAARERFGERLQDFASARVMEGDEKPIVSQGRILGWHTVYDYPTMRFMLRYNLPERYVVQDLRPGHPVYDAIAREVEARLHARADVDEEEVLASLDAKLDAMREAHEAAQKRLGEG